jgi:hypothetical protein
LKDLASALADAVNRVNQIELHDFVLLDTLARMERLELVDRTITVSTVEPYRGKSNDHFEGSYHIHCICSWFFNSFIRHIYLRGWIDQQREIIRLIYLNV